MYIYVYIMLPIMAQRMACNEYICVYTTQIVLIANDVTHQQGSFALGEDEMFYKASEVQ